MSWTSRRDRIDHGAPRLLWEQVAQDLAADIDSGDLTPGSKLPSEPELAELYGVARVTIRRAIKELAEHGLITVIHGRGTFVSPVKRGLER
jgi:GntR family transcriptional regulator